MSYQKLILIGNLGNDPEMRYTPGGQAVTNFSLATNRSYTTSDGQKVQETTWFRVSAWGKLAEVSNQYLNKGSKVMIEGRLVPDVNSGGPKLWQSKDGSMKANFEISADRVVFLDTKSERDEQPHAAQQPADNDQHDDEDEIPF